jgi:hypothetical protein
VVNDHDDDGEGAEKIEPGLALASGKARVDAERFTASLRPEERFVLGARDVNGLEPSRRPLRRETS